MAHQNKSALETIIGSYLDHDVMLMNELAEWCKSHREIPVVVSFKSELREAIEQPGIVTPLLYERWTGEDFENQQEVQERLQEIWDARFAQSN